MFIKSFLYFLFAVILQQSVFVKGTENECSMYAKCLKLKKCPTIQRKFSELSANGNVPYCNLNRRGSFVCCPIPQLPYYSSENENRTIARACKHYKSLRTCENDGLILGGKKCKPKEFPFMALLMYKNGTYTKYLCGGTLISPRFVLTAAHCFRIPTPPNTVRLGELDYNTTEDDASPIDFKILQPIKHHPNYEYFTRQNDIALIELDEKVDFKSNKYIFPACLPLPQGRNFDQSIAAGWGATSSTHISPVSSHLLKVSLDIYANDKCEEKIGSDTMYPINTTIQICAGSKDGKRDTCSGDSGGPIFVDHPDDNYRCLHLLYGVTSHGSGCGNKDYPAFYVRVSAYIDWIEKTVWPDNNIDE